MVGFAHSELIPAVWGGIPVPTVQVPGPAEAMTPLPTRLGSAYPAWRLGRCDSGAVSANGTIVCYRFPGASCGCRQLDGKRSTLSGNVPDSEWISTMQKNTPSHHRAGNVVKVLAGIAVVLVVLVAALPGIGRIYYGLDYVGYIQEAAERYQVNPYYIAAMIRCESNFDSDAVSDAGAIGLMQVMPETAQDMADLGLVDSAEYSPDELDDPETNINYGTAYLRYLVERYHEMNPAIAAYNAGMGNVDEWLEEDDDVRASVEFSETEKYIHLVNRAKEMYERFYPDVFDWE